MRRGNTSFRNLAPEEARKERTELKSSVKNGRLVAELKIPVRFTLNLKNLVGNRAPCCGYNVYPARPPKKLFFGNRQPHLPHVERNRPPQDTFLLSQEICRPPSNNPPRDTEVTCSAHLQTYGSVFFVLCSLCFIVLCIVTVQFDCFHCIERVFIVLNGFGVSLY